MDYGRYDIFCQCDLQQRGSGFGYITGLHRFYLRSYCAVDHVTPRSGPCDVDRLRGREVRLREVDHRVPLLSFPAGLLEPDELSRLTNFLRQTV